MYKIGIFICILACSCKWKMLQTLVVTDGDMQETHPRLYALEV